MSSEVESRPEALPPVIADEASEKAYAPDAVEAAKTLRAAGVEHVAEHALDVSNKRRFNGGATAPKWLDRFRHPRSEINHGPGTVMHVHTATRLRPEARTAEALNELYAHEARHAAQIEKRDWRLAVGLGGMAVLAAAGAAIGNRLGAKAGMPARLALTALGGLVGYKVGYQVAPHERDARKFAARHKSAVFRAKK